jgi:hypothetical protein
MDQRLLEIIEAQPEPERRRVRTKAERLREHWMAILMAASWGLGQVWTSTDWLHARETNERATMRDVEDVRRENREIARTYVRQDVFDQVLKRIEEHLASMDNKLEQRR